MAEVSKNTGLVVAIIQQKKADSVVRRLFAGACLYVLNLLLVLDFLGSAVLGADPRLSVSALLGIRLHRNPQGWLWRVLPKKFQDHCLESASWWSYTYPSVNRSIWS